MVICCKIKSVDNDAFDHDFVTESGRQAQIDESAERLNLQQNLLSINYVLHYFLSYVPLGNSFQLALFRHSNVYI